MVYIRVKDLDRESPNAERGRIYIDQMFIRSEINPSVATTALLAPITISTSQPTSDSDVYRSNPEETASTTTVDSDLVDQRIFGFGVAAAYFVGQDLS